MRVLGHVGILESLVTHKPEPQDPYASLTRQMKFKMKLIGHRAAVPIPYDLFPLRESEEKVWGKVYEYRSAIAHGDNPDFANRFKVLKNAETVAEFVERATRSVMRQLLDEPALMEDLQAI